MEHCADSESGDQRLVFCLCPVISAIIQLAFEMNTRITITTTRIEDSGPIVKAADFMLLFMLADRTDMVQFFKRGDRVIPLATRKRLSWQMADFEYCLAERWMNQYATLSNLCPKTNRGQFSVDINERLAYFRFELNGPDAPSFARLVALRSEIHPADCEQILAKCELNTLSSDLENEH